MHEQMFVDEPVVDILEGSGLHKLMLFFDIPAGWPGWLTALTGLALAFLTAMVWWLVSR